ncbi:helix-turn-helix domain-containing protein [Elioraea sp.]|uniref:helix-turn-helix domain-containing protein n=1 Tax=Elioraea sp. TaxID=2185103 RepID=UPI0025B87923|nr:helix-turn-helix transcriptional regulator [Elioraea sp.]
MSGREYPAYNKAVGRRLRALRTFYGKSVEFLAEYLGVSDKTVYGYESGQNLIGGEEAGKLAELYEVSLDYIYRGIVANLPDDLILHDQRVQSPPPAPRIARKRALAEDVAHPPAPRARRYTLHDEAPIPTRIVPSKGH